MLQRGAEMRTVFSRPCAWLAVAAAVVAGAAPVSASVTSMFMAVPANAAAPSGESVPISETFPAPVLSQACGFPITGGLEGTMTVKDFVDREGTFSQEITRFHMLQTFSANGHVVSGHTSEPIKTVVRPDGSSSVAFMGNDSMLTLPGSGPVIG